MSGLALFSRKSQQQALVQAPSLGLIQNDNELVVPKPEEIQCEMTPEELNRYERETSAKYSSSPLLASNLTLMSTQLYNFLKSNNFKSYPTSLIVQLMKTQVSINKTKLGDIDWCWTDLKSYINPIPLRIVVEINQIETKFRDKLVFGITDLENVKRYDNGQVYSWNQIIDKRLTEICFLRVGINSGQNQSIKPLIIDAWRGPTFSDEEAKI